MVGYWAMGKLWKSQHLVQSLLRTEQTTLAAHQGQAEGAHLADYRMRVER